jgi:DNA repair protein RadC
MLKESACLRGSKDARRYLSLLCGGMEREVFGLLLLNTRLQLLGIENVTIGSIDRTKVYSREIVKCCLRHNAAAAILFHNHPSGVAEPSDADKRLTVQLRNTLQVLDIRLLDHVVIAGMQQVSMAERKLL